jgi:plastocyanin
MKRLSYSGSRLLVIFLLTIPFLSLTDSCKKTTDVPGLNEVFIQGMAFTPSTITVSAGTTITWTNKDGVAHTVTSTTGIFNSQSISAGGVFSRIFSTAGTYPYYCTIHPTMTATVIVN